MHWIGQAKKKAVRITIQTDEALFSLSSHLQLSARLNNNPNSIYKSWLLREFFRDVSVAHVILLFQTGIYFLFLSKSLFRSVWYVSRRLCLEICWLPIDWTTVGLAPPFPSLKADQIVLWGVLSSRFYIFFFFLQIYQDMHPITLFMLITAMITAHLLGWQLAP